MPPAPPIGSSLFSRRAVPFEEALERVRHGPDYDADVPRGLQFDHHRTADGIEHEYAFVVPRDYDPSRPYQVRFYLHGGIARARAAPVNRIRVDVLPSGVDEIRVFPNGWVRALWWSSTQIENLARILDRLKRTYNIDENRVYLTGSSDGGTGVYYVAFRDPTAWASFVPMIGNMLVLGTPSVHADGEVFPGNAVNRPLYVVNTGRDPLYPAHTVEPYVDHLRKLGASVVFRVYTEMEHSTGWWADERPEIEAFVQDHPREPLPDKISWQTERVDRFNRANWLVIDRLGPVEGESRLADSNLLNRGRELDFGLRINSSIDRGRRAQEVTAGSNAFQIGLRTGDRFVEVNGKAVESGLDMVQIMEKWVQGERVRLVVERGGQRTPLEGVLARRSRAAADADFSPAQAVGPRRFRASRECRGDIDRRRESIYAAAVAVDLRFPPPIRLSRTAARSRRPGRAERADHAEVGRARQRSDDGFRGRAEHRTRVSNFEQKIED